jgi:putative lipoprotein
VCVVLATSPRARADDPDPWIARDKAFHFAASAGIASFTYAVAAYKLDVRWEALAIGGGVALAAGAGKELLDLAGLGDASWKDFAWDAIGTVAGLAIAWCVDMLLGGVDRTHPALAAPQASTSQASASWAAAPQASASWAPAPQAASRGVLLRF